MAFETVLHIASIYGYGETFGALLGACALLAATVEWCEAMK